METFKTVLTVFFAIITITSVVSMAVKERKNINFILSVWKRFRFHMLFETIGIVFLVLLTYILLVSFLPFLSWGWSQLFIEGGGNIYIAPVAAVSEHSSHWFMKALPFLFLGGLLVFVPFFAKAEEKWFRYECEKWREIIPQSIKFGLVHLIVGVPIATGIALIILGLYFGYKYKKAFDKNIKNMNYSEASEEALMASTVYHSFYNSFLVLILLVLSTLF